jgi:hypothetical protein
MSDKISEASWKAFVKKQKLAVELADKDLLKALAKLDKTDERKPEPRLEALKDLAREIPRQVTALLKLKKQLGDKPFGLVKDELYAILEEAETLQKQSQAALEAGQDEGDEEDEDSQASALINPKLLNKQLTRCRNDPGQTMKFAFVDAKDKQPAMLAMHPRMSAKSLFAKLQAAAGVKTGAYGSAWVQVDGEFKGVCLMLQLDKPLSGLVKKVRPPVKACGFKIARAVLWNPDGTVFEQDALAEEAVGEGAAPGASAAPATADAPGAQAEPNKTASTAPPQPSATYEAKLAALRPLVKKAAEQGSPDAFKHQKLMEFAAAKAAGKDHLGAVAALRQVEQLLANAAPKPTTAPAAKAQAGDGVDATAAFKLRLTKLRDRLNETRAAGHEVPLDASAKAAEAVAAAGKRDFERAHALLTEADSLIDAATVPKGASPTPSPAAGKPAARIAPEVAFTQSRLAWDDMRKRVQGELRKVETAVLDKCRGESDFATIAANLKQLYTMLDHLDERLIDQLDEALNAAGAEQRATLHAEARDIVAEYVDFVRSDEMLAAVDKNGFVAVSLVPELSLCLNNIDQQLRAALAA